MKIKNVNITGLKIIETKMFFDNRGFLKEVFRENLIKKHFKFDVMSSSKKNVIRGLHLQRKFAQGKYISVLKGEIFDVVVDLRKNSKNFGKYFSTLSAPNLEISVILPGSLSGFKILQSLTNSSGFKVGPHFKPKGFFMPLQNST